MNDYLVAIVFIIATTTCTILDKKEKTKQMKINQESKCSKK